MSNASSATGSLVGQTSGTAVNISVLAGQSVRLPNAPGNGGCLVTNLDLNYSIDLAPTQYFVPDSVETVQASQSSNWPEGPLWARVTPGQGATSVNIIVKPGQQALPSATPTQFPSVTTVTAPPAGDDWLFITAQASQLVAVACELNLSGAGTRTPTLVIDIGGKEVAFVIMSSAAIVASSGSVLFSLWAGAGVPFSRASDTFYTASLPNFILPAGSRVESSTPGLQAADTWTNIDLTFTNI